MSVYLKFLKNSFVIIIFALTLASRHDMVQAEEISMDAFRARFQEATGKTWDEADSEEKRDFVHKCQTTAAETLKKNTSETINTSDPAAKIGNKSSNLKRTVNVEVRKKFLAQYQKDWDEGTPEEQEIFLKKYKTQKQKEIKSELIEKFKKEKELKQIQKQRADAIREKEKMKRREEARKEKESRQLEKERKLEKKKLADRLKTLKKLQETSKRNEEKRK